MKPGIIIVDDHAAFRKILRQHLHDNSEFRVIAEFSDGIAVLEAQIDPQCSLILLDISMPKMNGFTVLAKISELYPEIRTIIVSGQEDKIFRRVAKEKGAAAFVSKDAVFENLIVTIRKVLAGQDSFSDSD